MYKLVLLRHGLSDWNKKNLFTGWTDVDLHPEGVEEAKKAGRLLADQNIKFDLAYTSYQKRAIKTLHITLEEMNQLWIPEEKSWRLNERHYGALQGSNKQQKAEEFGEEQVHLWRRSYDVRPPALTPDDPRHPINDPIYADVDPKDLPATECLKDTLLRVMPYWEQEIVPNIKAGKLILISAHGNSLRALVKYIEDISDDEIPDLNIPTGKPLIYELDENLKSISSKYLE